MLSNPALDHYGVFRVVPVERLIVDEASQIDAFEYMVRTLEPYYPDAGITAFSALVSQIQTLEQGVHVRRSEAA